MVLANTLFFLLGLILLVKGSDFFVKSAASIAKKLGVSDFIIGLTLVAFGTSIPELASSVAASLRGESGLVIGNVVGSNIANIGLIVGVMAVLASIKTNEEMLRRDGYIMLSAAGLFFVLIIDNTVSRVEAIFFLIVYYVYIIFLFRMKQKFKGRYYFREFLNYFFEFKYADAGAMWDAVANKLGEIKNRRRNGERMLKLKGGVAGDLAVLIVSGFFVAVGANYFIDGAIFFAEYLSIPKTIVGVSLIAVGTSLPELSVSISAAKKGYGNIAVGNIIGSNIANMFLIVGVSGVINPLSITDLTVYYTAPFMIFLSVLLLFSIKRGWMIKRVEGVVFLMLYAVFMAGLFVYA